MNTPRPNNRILRRWLAEAASPPEWRDPSDAELERLLADAEAEPFDDDKLAGILRKVENLSAADDDEAAPEPPSSGTAFPVVDLDESTPRGFLDAPGFASKGFFALLSVAMAAVLAWALWPANELEQAQPLAPRPTVAQVIEMADCVWNAREGARQPRLGQRLAHGDRLDLARGDARLRFDCGAVVTLNGPARFEIESDMAAVLHEGSVLAGVPREAIGFVVRTPVAKVLDLGTEFSLKVDDAGETLVQVLQGEVEMELVALDLATGQRRRLVEGESATIGSTDDKKMVFKQPEAAGPKHAPSASPRADRLTIDFTDEADLGRFEIAREDPSRYRLDPRQGVLSLDTTFDSIYGSGEKGKGNNLFLVPAPEGDFDVVLSVASFPVTAPLHHLGLVAMNDDDHFVRIIYVFNEAGNIVRSNREVDAAYVPLVIHQVDFGAEPFRLRLRRRGGEISASWAAADGKWTACGKTEWNSPIRHLGFYASFGHFSHEKASLPPAQARIDAFTVSTRLTSPPTR